MRTALVIGALGALFSAPSALARRDPGWPCLVELDMGPDGSYEDRRRFTYDGPASCRTPPDLDLIGCPTLEESLGPAGHPARTRAFTYDARGDLVGVEYRRDGQVTTRLSVRWGKELERLEVDGRPMNVYRRKGRTLIRETRMRGPSGPVKLLVTYFFDGRGRLLRTETDHGANGSIEARTVRRLEADRPQTEETLDARGKVIGRTRYLYSCPK